ncbi:CAP domain-containing protein [Mangrovimonas aestuarii]|uniref:CAP domain-containing protein n=1 Tax=Mangrovimonas aestuarii TaxID=3018443 RepID=UPI002377E62C|nr:CAP domain-containing protein [Mangrovimonas aestuarii]
MKQLTKFVLLALLVTFTFSCSTESLDDNSNTVSVEFEIPETKDIELQTLNLINDYRASLGLNVLNVMDVIKGTAFTHTDYMVETQSVSHDYFYDREEYLKSYASALKVNENVAYGYTSAESLFNAWLNSDSHRENIEGDFTDFDMSAEQDQEGKWYYTNIFIKR